MLFQKIALVIRNAFGITPSNNISVSSSDPNLSPPLASTSASPGDTNCEEIQVVHASRVTTIKRSASHVKDNQDLPGSVQMFNPNTTCAFPTCTLCRNQSACASPHYPLHSASSTPDQLGPQRSNRPTPVAVYDPTSVCPFPSCSAPSHAHKPRGYGKVQSFVPSHSRSVSTTSVAISHSLGSLQSFVQSGIFRPIK